MISPKTKMRVAQAVKDYQDMFPEEYAQLMIAIQEQRDNLQTDMAEIKGTNILKRALSTVSERLHMMIGKKITPEEQKEWDSIEVQRWFCKQFPQFSLTKKI